MVVPNIAHLLKVFTLAGVCLVSSVTFAQSEGEREQALELFQRGEASYREGDFNAAIVYLEDAYETFPEPVILYNLARAHEGRGDDQEAADLFERYLRDAGDVEDRGAIEARIVGLRARVAETERLRELEEAQEGREASEMAVEVEDGESAADPIASDASEESSSGPSALPWVVVGAGALVAATGIIPGVQAPGTQSDAQAALSNGQNTQALELQDKAEGQARTANILFAVGGGIALAGLIWGIIDLSSGDDDNESGVSVRIGPSSVTLHGRF